MALSCSQLPAGQGGSAVLHLEGSGFGPGSAHEMGLKDQEMGLIRNTSTKWTLFLSHT